MRLRKLDVKAHEKAVSEYDFDIESEDHLYVTFIDITEIQHGALEFFIGNGTYRICGDDDYDFIEVNPTNKHNYKNFEAFYDKHKAEFLSNDAGTRESKRVHEGFANIIRMLSRQTKCNNNTTITSMLLTYGAICFYDLVSKDDFDIIKRYHDRNAISAFDHEHYFDGNIALSMLSSPMQHYRNSRAVILDINRKNKVIHLYPDEFVFKTLEDLSILGFEGKSAIFGYELLISIALSNSEIIEELNIKEKVNKLSNPTIKIINSIILSDWIK